MRIVLLFVILFSLLTSNDSISLQLKWKHAFQFAGFYMAKEKGFYHESGLDVSLVEKEPDTNIVEDVLSSKATYGVSDSALVWDRIQGKQVVALKAIFQHSPLVLLSLKSSQIDSASEIKNRRIMISAESHQNASLMAMLKSYKVDESDLNIIPMTFDLNNLIEGKTELFTAYATDQPYTLQSKGIPYNIHDPSAYGFDFYGDILFTSESELKNHPNRVKKFLQATIRGWQYAFEHIDETIDVIFEKYNTQKFNREKLYYEAVKTRELSGYDKGIFGDIDPKKIKEIAKTYALLGFHGEIKNLDGFLSQESKSETQKSQNESKQLLDLTTEEQLYLKEKGAIKICTAENLPPFSFTDKGSINGITLEYFKLFQTTLDTPIGALPTKNIQESIEKTIGGECDAYVVLIPSVEQYRSFKMTKSYFSDSIVLATQQDEVFIPNIADLAHKKIGILGGSDLLQQFKNIYPLLDFVSYPDIKDGFDALNRGEIFGLASAMIVLSYAMQHDYPLQFKISAKFKKSATWNLAVDEQQPKLHALLNRAIDAIKADEKQMIYNKWVGITYEKEFDYALLWKIATLFLLIVLILIYRNQKLISHQKEIDYIAFNDTLTGLPNREAFSRILKQAISTAKEEDGKFSILFIDLDRFKNVNDTLGHTIGDQMVQIISTRIRKKLHQEHAFARIGGDEFVVLVTQQYQKDIESIAQEILETISQNIRLKDYDLHTTASIGIAHYPDDGADMDTLLKNADSAMYLAKERGKDNYQHYTTQRSQEVQHRMQIEHDLRKAINNDELYLLYQPQYDLNTQKVIAAEALLRWNHPKYGAISPTEFIPIAEDSGYILELSNWIFVEACRTFMEWKKQGLQLHHISINISGVQFNQDNIVEKFEELLEMTGINASEVELEITEHSLIENIDKNLIVLEKLRKIGFRLSIDDFGIGYSSMNYLKRLPLDTIKIDKSFVDEIPQNPSDVAIIKAILALGKNLNYQTIAEGIEQEKQQKFLLDNECDIGQGYLFSKPIDKESFVTFFREKNRREV